MRRRSRHARKQGEPPERPTTTVDEAVDVITRSDAPLDDALRALARLLARQAAREIFERECALDKDRLTLDSPSDTSEGLQ